MSDTIARIKDLTSNARATWLSLLGVLLFVGVTLMGVTDADFYAVNRATDLPLVGVSVPTDLFFFTAPVLVAAVYIYFHLYLIRLVDALAVADARIEGQRLGDAVSPWLLTDAALYVRSRGRDDGCRTPRVLDWSAMVVNFNLSWGFGPLVLAFAVYQSLPARDWVMTGIASGSLFLASVTGLVSLYALNVRMRRRDFVPARRFWLNWLVLPFVLFSGAGLAWYTQATTTGSGPWLAPINLREANLTEKPDGWQPYSIARKEFAEQWCKRSRLREEDRAGCTDPDVVMPQNFEDEWTQRRDSALVALTSPVHTNHSFRGLGTPPNINEAVPLLTCKSWFANLSAAFLPRADLSGADFTCTELHRSNLEGSILANANFAGASLSSAQLQGAFMGSARLKLANLIAAQLQGADLSEAHMQRANLASSQMQGTNLRYAQMQGANFSLARMQGADLEGANLQESTLLLADLSGTQLSYSALLWTKEKPAFLNATDFRASSNFGGAVRHANLSAAEFDEKTDWRNVFLDGSVTLPQTLIKMHSKDGSLPCQWEANILEDADFYGRWRWWVNKGGVPWSSVAPEAWKEVPINPGPTGCDWQY